MQTASADESWASAAQAMEPTLPSQERRGLLAGKTEARLRARVEELSSGMTALLARVDGMGAASRPGTSASHASYTQLGVNLGEGPDEDWLTGPASAGYGPPTESEALPMYLLSASADSYVTANPELYVLWNTRSMFKWALSLTISRKFGDNALQKLSGFNHEAEALPFEAVWGTGFESLREESNAPRLGWVPWLGDSRSPITTSWLGCRCSWPCTQLCWLSCISCGLHQHFAIVWSLVTLAFEFIILDAMVVQDFIAKVPDRITSWEDYATIQKPLSAKIAIIFIYLVFPFFVVGYLWGTSSKREGNLNSYYPSIYQARIILRSIAARYEGNGYGYCTVLFWAAFLEVRHTHTHTHTHIYIYIYIERERERET